MDEDPLPNWVERRWDESRRRWRWWTVSRGSTVCSGYDLGDSMNEALDREFRKEYQRGYHDALHVRARRGAP